MMLSCTAGAGRYARSLRLMLRKARRRRVVPPASAPNSTPGSPSAQPNQLPSAATSNAAPQSTIGSTLIARTPTFLPPPPSPSAAGSLSQAQGSPFGTFDLVGSGNGGDIGGSSGPGIDITESSPSGSFLSFDWTYAEDLLGSVGMSVQDSNGVLPLWLSDSDLGSQQLLSGGMEDFFLPSDIDVQLDLYSSAQGGTPGPIGGGAGIGPRDASEGTAGMVGSGGAGDPRAGQGGWDDEWKG